MRIKQCKMLDSQRKIFKNFVKEYSLKKYYNPSKPAVFYSLWAYSFIKNHKSFALIIWRGSDIVKMQSRLFLIARRKNIYHIAISSYIIEDLKRYKIKYKFIPVVGVKMDFFKPAPLGDEIYTYVPNTHSKYYKRYGMKLVQKIQKKCKYKINIVIPGQYSKEELVKVYKRCFCSLRLTKHDGLPSQVIEMGLMGRRSLYNGNIPGTIKWVNNVDKIIEKIEIEAKKIGTIDHQYANQISDFIDIGDKWLDTEFWT